MSWPEDPAPLHVELFYGGAWQDITSDVRNEQGIRITRGYAASESGSEGARPSSCTLTLNNRDDKYSRRNPLSPLYGRVGKNTPLRVRRGDPVLSMRFGGYDGAVLSTPDAAPLDITGDLDFRLAIVPDRWKPRIRQVLAAKERPTGNQRSWTLRLLTSGKLELAWSVNGSSRNVVASTVEVPEGTAAIRVTLDVNNGASGNTVTYYTSTTPSTAGPWTQLGDHVVTAGTTSLFNSSAALTIGAQDGGGVEFGNERPFLGTLHGAELRSGIGGTVVANPVFTGLQADAGGAVFTDAAGREWTAGDGAQVVDASVRVATEVGSWPKTAHISGRERTAPIQGDGIRRRLSQGTEPLKSVLYRALTDFAQVPALAYWPCEDGRDATQIASAIGGPPMTLGLTAAGIANPDTDFAAYSDFVASEPIMQLNVTTAIGAVPSAAPTGELRTFCIIRVPEDGLTSACEVLTLRTTGTAAEWALEVGAAAGGGDLTLKVRDRFGAQVQSTGPINFNINGRKLLLSLWLVQNGTAVDWRIEAFDEGGRASLIPFSSSLPGQTLGAATHVLAGAVGDLEGTAMGHIAVRNTDTASLWDVGADVLDGRAGERAGTRMARLCREEGIPFTFVGDPDDTPRMGPQAAESVLALLDECAELDGGLFAERRDALALEYRTRRSLYNQDPVLTLSHAEHDLAEQPEPLDDDQATRNDITVKRRDGGSVRAMQIAGALNVNDPMSDPDGVGRYQDDVTLNVASDGQLLNQATWRRHLGTIDEDRFPTLKLDLARRTNLLDAALAVQLGDRLVVTDTTAWLSVPDISQIVRGYDEFISRHEHRFDWVGTPESAYRVAIGDDDERRCDTGGSAIAAAIDATAPTVDVATLRGAPWTTDPAQFPFAVLSGGEEWTVTDIDSAAVDTFTRTVSNGWGSTTSGRPWTATGGTAANFSVTGSEGRIAHTTVNASRLTTIPLGSADVDLAVAVSTDKLAAGAGQQVGLVAQYVDAANFYLTLLQFTNVAAVNLYLFRFAGGVATTLASTGMALTHVANTKLRLRFKIHGRWLKAKAWLASTAEPQVWHLRALESTVHGPGDVGLYSLLESGTSNAPVTVAADNFEVTNPQTFTVVRAVNGISKAHTTGTPVNVAHPATVGL